MKITAERLATHRQMTKTSRKFAPTSLPPSSVAHVFVEESLMQSKPVHPWACLAPMPQSKSPAAMVPHAPQAPCTAKASTGSSTLQSFKTAEASENIRPPQKPMQTAEPHSTLPQPAVIETRPARIPLQKPPISYFLVAAKRMRKTTRPPVAAESVVFIATCAPIIPLSAVAMPSVEPQLKPYHPNQRMKVPRTTVGWLWGQ
mmetsp:Transcript_19988/g.42684  ORF Transcript_19988/g.42684 Transcript_19988/m.42684 type:complete len:202 (+) Transcript_19988:194-799(+)